MSVYLIICVSYIIFECICLEGDIAEEYHAEETICKLHRLFYYDYCKQRGNILLINDYLFPAFAPVSSWIDCRASNTYLTVNIRKDILGKAA